jgi:tRNA(Ile)-lysidine synthase
MAARDLRYNWFSEIADEFAYSCIAIAHNSDDNIETFHLNLSRGTGISGITGMDSKSGKIVRPILWASRKTIVEYCNTNKLSFREDSSNLKTKYKRNFLRHEIIPKFNTINPSYSETILQNMEFFKQSSVMLDDYFELLSKDLVVKSGDDFKISIKKLRALAEPAWFLFKFLSPYEFNSRQINDISHSLESESGKRFHNLKNILIKDRDYLVLSTSRTVDKTEYSLGNSSGTIESPLKLKWDTISFENYQIKKNPLVANLDASKITFPLTIRKWKDGDSFHPFGMQGVKKLSDFFIDQKLSVLDKENVWLLLSGNEIVWVIGHRIDNLFRVHPETKQILQIAIDG